jgi:antitoxin component HigA of HigAB toxin-antitoxin module
MEKFNIDNILKIATLDNEYEFEKATTLHSQLRVQIKEDPSLKEERKHLRKLIKVYEAKHWSDLDQVSDDQIKESDRAEKMIMLENTLKAKRKEVIKKRLKRFGLSQNDLAFLLGHKKNYMSELINGIRPFSKTDIQILNRTLRIPIQALYNPFLKEDVAVRVREAIKELDKPELKLKEEDLELC